MYLISLICLALLLFGTTTSLRAQEEPTQDEPQQEAESKQDNQQGKKDETKSEKKEEKRKKGEAIPRLRAVIWHPTIAVNQLNLFYGVGARKTRQIQTPNINSKKKT
jgi:cytoskeletal protein RodZ